MLAGRAAGENDHAKRNQPDLITKPNVLLGWRKAERHEEAKEASLKDGTDIVFLQWHRR